MQQLQGLGYPSVQAASLLSQDVPVDGLLCQRVLEGVHPVFGGVLEPDERSILQLHERSLDLVVLFHGKLEKAASEHPAYNRSAFQNVAQLLG